MSEVWKVVGWVILVHCVLSIRAQTNIKGPPVAQKKEMQAVHWRGEDVKIVCPISGNPTPIFNWYRGEEKIDHSWIRIRAMKKWMKIKNVEEEDTGVYYCKGINGFGNAMVTVHLIVLDQKNFPNLKDGEFPDISVPTFTTETLETRRFYTLQSGDSFRITCAATGNPSPKIFWFKDGLPFDADGIRYRNGKSTLRLRNLMKVDSAVYTCQARNIIGTASHNYTLNVESAQSEQSVVVGNGNVSVFVGDTASLQCRVGSLAPPHIKWLKKDNPGTPSDMFTINVGEDKYRVIPTGEDIFVGQGQYLNKLIIPNAQESDSGLYICFVSNPGGSFNYKPTYLRVYPLRSNIQPAKEGESVLVLALVISLGIMVLLILVFMIVCVVHKSAKSNMHAGSNAAEVARTLMPTSCSTDSSATIMTVTSNKFDQPLPPPPSMWGTTTRSGVYKVNSHDFNAPHENSSTNLLTGADRDSPVSLTGNQYEVPYCYSVRTLDSVHKPASTATGYSSTITGISDRYPFRQYPHFQYLSDCDA